jgi:hypothetical protein
MIGLFFMIFGMAITGSVMYWYIWISIAFAIAVPFGLQYLAAPMFSCAYTGRCTGDAWVYTVRRVAFWGILFGGIGALVGGYYFREWAVIMSGKTFNNLSTVNPPDTAFGQTSSFVAGALPHASVGGRALAFGFYPICVAPIHETSAQRSVSYWAVGAGICCTKQPINCDSWTAPLGGTRLKYTEFYNALGSAASDAVTTNNLLADPNAIYIKYGDPDDIIFLLRRNFLIAFFVPVAVGFIFMLWRSIRGPYELKTL